MWFNAYSKTELSWMLRLQMEVLLSRELLKAQESVLYHISSKKGTSFVFCIISVSFSLQKEFCCWMCLLANWLTANKLPGCLLLHILFLSASYFRSSSIALYHKVTCSCRQSRINPREIIRRFGQHRFQSLTRRKKVGVNYVIYFFGLSGLKQTLITYL